MSMPQIVLGTHNAKKRAELEALLCPYGYDVKSLDDFADALEVVEDGTTFAENAVKKATEQALHLGQWVIGEDSGLCVDALEGAPGVHSARFAGENATDEQNNQHLLTQLAGVTGKSRGAHYVCHMALSNPQGQVVVSCQAQWPEHVQTEPHKTSQGRPHRITGTLDNAHVFVEQHIAHSNKTCLADTEVKW